LKRLSELQVRIFTTDKLFDETREHWWFANRVVSGYGAMSLEVLAAARGEVPFRRSNAFLQGFIQWQAAGNPPDWGTYNFETFGNRQPETTDIRKTLEAFGVEVIEFPDWPGFVDEDFVQRDTYRIDSNLSEEEGARTLSNGRRRSLGSFKESRTGGRVSTHCTE
jgi:hypothetical protein